MVNENSLRGLAVPTDGDNIIDDVAVSQDKRDSFSRTRFNMPGFQLTDHEYIKTIQALADFLRDQGAASARIFVIDEVNPLPFVLGAAAPRGGVLWPAERSFWQPPEQALREADYVAIPRFPLHRMTALLGLETYREYLSERFVRRYKTPYWDVLERRELP